jgi:hypothetical protein
MRCKRCRSSRLVLDRIFPARDGSEHRRFRCTACGHFRSKKFKRNDDDNDELGLAEMDRLQSDP